MKISKLAYDKDSRSYFFLAIFLPALFFLLYVFINIPIFLNPGFEDGDFSSYALQIMRAKSFQEYLGPYSRFNFNHPGPIAFYYYAFMEVPLFFITNPFGRHLAAQFLLNLVFIFISLHIFYTTLEKKYLVPVFFIVMLLSMYHQHTDIFINMWPPALLIFPTLTFTLAVAKISTGGLKYLYAAVLSGLFIVQNNISGLALVLPFSAIAAISFLWNRRRPQMAREAKAAHPDGVQSKPGRQSRHLPVWLKSFWSRYLSPGILKEEAKTIALSLIFVFMAFLPPLYEQFSAEKGNLSKIYEFLRRNHGLQHPLDEVIPFVLNFFAAPLKGFVPIPPAIVVLIMTGGSMLILSRKKSFMNYLVLLAFSGTIFSILGAMRMPGNLLPYVLKFESSFVALLYFSCIAGALRWIKIPAPAGRAMFLLLILAVFPLTQKFYKVRATPADPKYDEIIQAVTPEKGVTYELFWKKGSQHHGQWSVAAQLALKLKRAGYDVCVPKEWEAIFGKKLVCQNDRASQRIALYSTENHTFQVREHLFSTRGTTVEFGEMKPLLMPLDIRFDFPEEYFPGWFPAGEKERWVSGSPARIIIPLGEVDQKAQYVIQVTASSEKNKTTRIFINGHFLADTAFNPHAMEKKSFLCGPEFFESHVANSVELHNLTIFDSLKIQKR